MNLLEVFHYVKTNYPESTLYNDFTLIENIECLDSFQFNFEKEHIYKYENHKSPSITCGLIIYNEERNIKKCLSSVYKKFDEIIIMDSFSTDNTISIIENEFPNAMIFKEIWRNDFSYHRNLVINYASTDWIYFIDADNYYCETNRDKAKRIAKLLDFFKVTCVVSTKIIEHTGHIYLDNKRFFPLNKDIYFHGKVHEEPLLNGISLPNLMVQINVEHDGYDPDKVNQYKKNERNLKLTTEMMELEPDNPKWLYFFSREMHLSNADPNIIKPYLFKAIDLYQKTKIDKNHYIDTIILFCTVLLSCNDLRTMHKYLSLLDEEFPNCADTIFLKATLLFTDIQNKARKVIQLIDANNINTYSVINSNMDHLKYLKMKILSSLEQWEEVYKIYESLKTSRMKIEFQEDINDFKKIIDSKWGHNYDEKSYI